MYCDDCLPKYRDEHTISFNDAGRGRMAKLRAAGMDLSRGGDATWGKEPSTYEGANGVGI